MRRDSSTFTKNKCIFIKNKGKVVIILTPTIDFIIEPLIFRNFIIIIAMEDWVFVLAFNGRRWDP